MIEGLIGPLFIFVGAIIIAMNRLYEKESRSVSGLLGLSAMGIGFTIDFSYMYSSFSLYAFVITGFAIIAGALYLVFRRRDPTGST